PESVNIAGMGTVTFDATNRYIRLSDMIAIGSGAIAHGSNSLAVGTRTIASGTDAVAVGTEAIADGRGGLAQGYRAIATGEYASASGSLTSASGYTSHAEGHYSTATNEAAHAEGYSTRVVCTVSPWAHGRDFPVKVVVSEDGGKTFEEAKGLPDYRTHANTMCGACGATAGVYVSEDGGENWTKTPGFGDWIFNVEVTPKGTIYAGGSQLWRSDDHGRTFRPVTSLRGVTVTGIAFDPADERRVWISATTWDGNRAGGLYESVDGCRNWTEITGDIPYSKPLVVRYDPASRQLWAAGPGAFRTRR
ncbi:MAG: hypothetical protein IJ783_01485, partial [Kiritimatiellae bacterium]|nr:hypothetical protein [Kiritimatiellia bacterium]